MTKSNFYLRKNFSAYSGSKFYFAIYSPFNFLFIPLTTKYGIVHFFVVELYTKY